MEIDDIITRMLMKTNSYEDIINFAQWLNEKEEHRAEFKKIESYWNANTKHELNISAEDSFKKLQIKIEQSQMKRLRRSRILSYGGIAASLIIVFCMGFFMKKDSVQEVTEQYVCMTEGSISAFYLRDSTKVILNKNSEISYSSCYGKKERKVKLIGEAYFEVKKNAASPFVVDMNGTAVKVLGTKFMVNNRKNSDIVKAVLLEGSVRFISNEQNVLMKPNQKLQFNRSNKNLELMDVDSEQEVAWKDGLFKYRSLSLGLLMDRLEKDYDVNIVINNKQLFNPDLKFTGSFEQNVSFEKVLEVINRTIKIKWKKEKGIYYIN